MTATVDPLAGTDLRLADLPEGMVGFGVAEVGFLLSLHPGAVTTHSRELLGLDERVTTDATYLLCGASSLTARGMLVGSDQSVQTRSSAALLEVALGQAVRWTRVGLLTRSEPPRVVFFLQSPVVCAVLELSVAASCWVSFGDAADDPGAVLEALVDARLTSGGATVIVDVSDGDGVRRNLLVGSSPEGLRVVADAEPGGVGGRELDVERADLAQLLRSMVPAVPA